MFLTSILCIFTDHIWYLLVVYIILHAELNQSKYLTLKTAQLKVSQFTPGINMCLE